MAPSVCRDLKSISKDHALSVALCRTSHQRGHLLRFEPVNVCDQHSWKRCSLDLYRLKYAEHVLDRVAAPTSVYEDHPVSRKMRTELIAAAGQCEGHSELLEILSNLCVETSNIHSQRVANATASTGSFTPSTKPSTFNITLSSKVSGQLAPLVRMIVSGRFAGSQLFVVSSLCAG
jgi:hypothetical protein